MGTLRVWSPQPCFLKKLEKHKKNPSLFLSSLFCFTSSRSFINHHSQISLSSLGSLGIQTHAAASPWGRCTFLLEQISIYQLISHHWGAPADPTHARAWEEVTAWELLGRDDLWDTEMPWLDSDKPLQWGSGHLHSLQNPGGIEDWE